MSIIAADRWEPVVFREKEQSPAQHTKCFDAGIIGFLQSHGIQIIKESEFKLRCHDGDIYDFSVIWSSCWEGYRWMSSLAHIDGILRRYQP